MTVINYTLKHTRNTYSQGSKLLQQFRYQICPTCTHWVSTNTGFDQMLGPFSKHTHTQTARQWQTSKLTPLKIYCVLGPLQQMVLGRTS